MSEYIEREAAIDKIEGIDWFHVGEDGRLLPGSTSAEMETYVPYQLVEDALNNLPAADVRPVVRGRWKPASYSGKFGSAKEKWYDQFFDGAFWYCDQCRERARKSNFCPNCGADMRPTSMSGANGEES